MTAVGQADATSTGAMQPAPRADRAAPSLVTYVNVPQVGGNTPLRRAHRHRRKPADAPTPGVALCPLPRRHGPSQAGGFKMTAAGQSTAHMAFRSLVGYRTDQRASRPARRRGTRRSWRAGRSGAPLRPRDRGSAACATRENASRALSSRDRVRLDRCGLDDDTSGFTPRRSGPSSRLASRRLQGPINSATAAMPSPRPEPAAAADRRFPCWRPARARSRSAPADTQGC
jgi:hypothetical protein